MTDNYQGQPPPATAEDRAAFSRAWREMLPAGVKHLQRLRVPFVDVHRARKGTPISVEELARLVERPAPVATPQPATLTEIVPAVEQAVARTVIGVLAAMKGKR